LRQDPLCKAKSLIALRIERDEGMCMSPFAQGESPFNLPPDRSAKAASSLIESDEEHLAAVRDALTATIHEVEGQLAATRRQGGGSGQSALDRDLEVRRLSARLQFVRRFGLDACLGRIVQEDSTAPLYIGRFGLSTDTGRRLLVDWRAPAARPFFAATRAHPLGLSSRRRYRWAQGKVVDYWDEVFATDGVDHSAALDDESAFITSLGASRSSRMRDVLATLQSDQDTIIRADSAGALVVDGGPGTGKTVVALHRAAYLLYADERVRSGAGRVLFVGPHEPYLAYIEDVLPSLGEDGALTCTLGDLVPGGEHAAAETDPALRELKSDARLVDAMHDAARLWEHLPARPMPIDTPWGEVTIRPADWEYAFDGAATMTHNDVRDTAWESLVDLLTERIEVMNNRREDRDGRWEEGWGDDGRASDDLEGERWGVDEDGGFDAYGMGDGLGSVRDALANDEQLREAFDHAWPLLDPDAVLRRLLGSANLLRRSAPWLDDNQIDLIGTTAQNPWADVDLPLLDAVRLRVGDPLAERERRRARAEEAESRRRMSDVVSDLIANDDSDMHVMSMLRGQDMRAALDEIDPVTGDPFAGPFAHIVVDEAQELSDAQWRMLVRRCPSRSFTIVGDRAQARRGFRETWLERLNRVGLADARVSELTVNYRTPVEVMDVAAPAIRAVLPDANVPTSIRSSGIPVRYGDPATLDDVLRSWLDAHPEGVAAVIGADLTPDLPDRVRALTPTLSKGLEFDLVVLLNPTAFGDTVTGGVDRYVAMTRATQELVVLGE